MQANENVIAYIATLSGMERQVAIDVLDSTCHPESWIVPLTRQWEIRDAVMRAYHELTASENHRIAIEKEQQYDAERNSPKRWYRSWHFR